MIRPLAAGCGVLVLIASTVVSAVPAGAVDVARPATTSSSRACPPHAVALGYSDALDGLVYDGVTVGGLSSLAYDRRSHAWVSAVDNDGSQPERIWFFRDLAHPRVVRAPLILRKADGTPYNGNDSDNEGLAVLPDGDYLVSSETEPSVRIYRRDGVQRAQLPVPARFRVAPAGQATDNKTLEGLSISPSGQTIVAAMEGALSGDESGTSPADQTLHRFLVYTRDGGRWDLHKQIAYRTDVGQRVPEVALVSDDRLIVEEASYDASTGNAVSLYEVTGLRRARNVAGIADLATAPRGVVVGKQLVANLVRCPTLGAPAKETQTNPLLDNYEGMAITFRHRATVGISMISDNNFSSDQWTRVLNLTARLPRR